MDQAFRLHITGLPPGAPATLIARAQAADGVWWQAVAALSGAPAADIEAAPLIAAMTAGPAPIGVLTAQSFAVNRRWRPLHHRLRGARAAAVSWPVAR